MKAAFTMPRRSLSWAGRRRRAARGAPSGVFDVVAAAGAQQIVCEGAHPRDDVGILSDARSVLGESNIAHIMAAVLDAPMASDPVVPSFRRRAQGRGNPKDDLGRLLAKARGGIAPADCPFQPQHGFDQRLPRRMAKPRFGGKTVSSRVSQRLRPLVWLFA